MFNKYFVKFFKNVLWDFFFLSSLKGAIFENFSTFSLGNIFRLNLLKSLWLVTLDFH